jgi:hypothetical protein
MELTASGDAPAGFPFEEKRARIALGLNKDDARALRKRALGEADFVIHKKRLYLSAAALEKMRAGLSATGAASCPGSIVSEPPAEIESLRVVKADLKNRRLILACSAEDDLLQPKRPLRVRVRSQVNFRPGMEIPARRVAGYADLYDLTRPCPRKKGKW